jgi:hypothetical protein
VNNWPLVLLSFFIIGFAIILLIRPGWIQAVIVALRKSIIPNVNNLKSRRDLPGLVSAIEICHRRGNLAAARQAALALGELGPEAIPALIQILENYTLSTKDYPGIIAAALGPAAIPGLLELIQQDNSFNRFKAGDALEIAAQNNPEFASALRSPETWPVLVKAYQSCEVSFEQRPFANLLSLINKQEADKIINQAREIEQARENSARVERLIGILQTGDYKERLHACAALGKTGSLKAVPALEKLTRVGPGEVELLFDMGQKNRMKIAYPNGGIPSSEKETLWQSLAPRSQELQTLAASAITQIKDESASRDILQ